MTEPSQEIEYESAGILKIALPAISIALIVFITNYQSVFAETASGISIETEDLSEAESKTSSIRQLLIVVFAGLGGIFTATSRRPFQITVPLCVSTGLLVGFIAASTVWSDDPSFTVRRAAIIVLVTMGAFGVARHWSLMDLCSATFWISAALIVISLMLDIKARTFLSGEEYRFSGAFHPNRQALVCCLFTLSSFTLFKVRNAWVYLLLAIVGLMLVRLTGSRGSLVAVILAIGSGFWISAQAKQRVLFIFAGLFLTGVFVLSLALEGYQIPDEQEISKMIARSSEAEHAGTLTGRIPIWSESFKAISKRPILGYGFGAFWSAHRIQEFSLIHEWAFSNAHSIYFETVLNIGLVGLLLLTTVVVAACWSALTFRTSTNNFGILFFLSLLVLGAVNGLVEAVFVTVGLETILVGIGCLILMTRGDIDVE